MFDNLDCLDKFGNKVPWERLIELWGDMSYRRVDLTYIGSPPNQIEVSTVWLGLPELAAELTGRFETMIFDEHKQAGECVRAMTLADARRNHLEVVKNLRAKLN